MAVDELRRTRGAWRSGADLALLLCVLASASASQLSAQSLTHGSLAGTVQDGTGRRLRGVTITLWPLAGGTERVVAASPSGRFAFSFLVPGEYELFVERLGYQPARITDILVQPNLHLPVAVTLRAAEPPVYEIDSIPYAGVVAPGAGVGGVHWFAPFTFTDVPAPGRNLADLARLATIATPELASEGLPARLSRVAVDGIGFEAALHPGLRQDLRDWSAFPFSGFGAAELVTPGADVEWSEFAGAVLHGHMRRAGTRFRAEAFGDWFGDALISSGQFDPGSVSLSSIRAGAVLSGPVIGDTAGFVIGSEIQRLDVPMPAPVERSALNQRLVATASDAFGLALEGYLNPYATRVEREAVFGRFDWRIAAGQDLSVRANLARSSATNPDLGPDRVASLGAALDGSDVAIGAGLLSEVADRIVSHFRVGFSASQRDYRATGAPSTVLSASGAAVAGDPSLPGEFERTETKVSETLLWTVGAHTVKVGGGATVLSHDATYSHGRGGEFVFSDTSAFAARRGAFVQSVGSLPIARFTATQFALYLQDRWELAPGVETTVGLRYELERLPAGDVAPNREWQQQSGLARDSIDGVRHKFSPRFGLVWRPAERGDWVVRVQAGVVYDRIEMASFGELLSHDGRVQVRRGVGDLGAWPDVPDSSAAAVLGPRLTLLGPRFEAPRTNRVLLGVSRFLGSVALHLGGTYRHTEFLMRRTDLNRLTAPTAVDQHERPLYGVLEKDGGVLTATPGSNRRFPDFDLVSALNPDGFSDYWAATVALEGRIGMAADFYVAYTFSRTTDNWLFPTGGAPDDQLTPFPDAGAAGDWADGTSDFDVPHRLVTAFRWKLFPSVHLAAFYRFQSGRPFTPGFRAGVDANGDGSARNDPAFVDDNITGVSDLFGAWDCLRQQAGRFVDRNSCRSPGQHALDVRLTVDLLPSSRSDLAVTIDGLNLIEPEVAVPDAALYLVDPAQPLGTDATTGAVQVPLLANPRFGSPLVRRSPGRIVRVGLRVSF